MFYDKFLQLCKQKGVSPSKAAVDAGISKSLVTKWKTNGCKDPSPEVIRKVASYFSISVSDLLQDSLPATKEDGDILDEIDVSFYGDYKALSEDDKQTIRAMARLMRERRDGKNG